MDLSEAVFREVGLSRNESAELVESVLRHMSDALAAGETVKISSFGTFSVREKGARVGRNPKTGEEVPIQPRRVLTFRPVASDERPRGSRQPGLRRTDRMEKSPDAFRTISEVSEWLETPAHVLRFWESRFTQVKPVKRAGGRRYYRPTDMALLGGIKKLLHDDGLTIRGVQKILRSEGVRHVAALSPAIDDLQAPMTEDIAARGS